MVFDLLHSYTISQLVGKVVHELKFRLYKKMPSLVPAYCCPDTRISSLFTAEREDVLEGLRGYLNRGGTSAEDVKRGVFSFGGETHTVESLWSFTKGSRLFLFHLQYLDWFHELADAGDIDECREHLDRWIGKNKPGTLDGWHPYCLSLRIVNILSLWSTLTKGQDEHRIQQWVSSLWNQYCFLKDHNERFLSANHYMENVIALSAAECFFSVPQKKQYGIGLIDTVVLSHVLEDGSHYEGSWGYHIRMEARLTWLFALFEKAGIGRCISAKARQRLGKMHEYTASMAQGLKEPPLFGDSWSTAPLKIPGVSSNHTCGMPESECVVHNFPFGKMVVVSLGRPGDKAIFTYQSPGAPDNPGHGHCDCTSFELFLDGKRIICDGGNHSYKNDETRWHYRSSKAHNVAVIDGVEQSQLFGAFRGGKRTVGSFAFTNEEKSDFTLSYVPIVSKHPLKVLRKVTCSKDGEIGIHDSVEGLVQGKTFTSLLHIVPEAKVTQVSEREVKILLHSRELTIRMVSGDDVSVSNASYSKGFGHMETCTLLQITGKAVLFLLKP